jgi:predicted RNA-binding Zn ribbon-like protein
MSNLQNIVLTVKDERRYPVKRNFDGLESRRTNPDVGHAVKGERRAKSGFLFAGNSTCLDFLNTQMIVRGRRVDLLEDVDDLLSWLVQAKVFEAAEVRAAAKQLSGRPEGARLFDEARSLRGALRTMLDRIVKGRPVQQPLLDVLNRLLRNRIGYSQVVRTRGGFERKFHSGAVEAAHLLVPLAELAGDLLCGYDLALIKKCENPACILFFYDTTKNHARRWCSMKLCGNRMKVAAHYRRQWTTSPRRTRAI